MTRSTLLLFALLLGCGGASSAAAGPTESSAGSEVVLSRTRADLVCTEVLPSGESACAARGCTWSAPLYCSGIERPPDLIHAFESDVSRPCVCVCQRDVLECMARP